MKKRVYSGVRATGRLHLGNYYGAIKGMLALQDDYDCVFSVVDLHAITTPYSPKLLQRNIREVVLDFLAAGLDPEKCALEIQSQLPHTDLAYLLSTIYPVSRLEDLPTYKEKKAQYPKYVNMGLLYYPVLMAADILLYKADLVPVGIDQEPHLEVAREIARKFNSMFGETFPEPKRFKTNGEYIPSLLGKGKMSKTVEGSYISLVDDFNEISSHLAKAPTDTGVEGGEIPLEGGVANLFTLLKLFSSEVTIVAFTKEYQEGKIKYVELKKVLAEDIYKELKPLQERRREFENQPDLVDTILANGREKCEKMAFSTLSEVKDKMGISVL